jgi:alanine-glyoxylate transaminase / serine-glyoxylate transaminase / serine-pyruvate transaminase
MAQAAGMSSAPPPSLAPPERLLAGPGPTNVDPAALAAMQRPMVSHLDPVMWDYLLEVSGMLRRVYRAASGLVLPLHCTGMAGMEAGIANLVEPGDKVIVGRAGFFGGRISEVAARYGAEVIEVAADWGEVVAPARLLEALDVHPDARLVAVVHAETSTGARYPLAELGAALRDRETLLFADCVTSLGGIEVDFDAWGLDFAYSCTQKCLAAPPGMSPLAVSERALHRIRARTRPVGFSFDLLALERYWIRRPVVYHHTAPILHIYALHEALRGVLEEGLEARFARHEQAGRRLREVLGASGLRSIADPDHQLPQLTAVRVPDGVDGKDVQGRLLDEHGIEVGGGIGPSAPPMWRIGLMGPNASVATAEHVAHALDAVLAHAPALARTR